MAGFPPVELDLGDDIHARDQVHRFHREDDLSARQALEDILRALDPALAVQRARFQAGSTPGSGSSGSMGSSAAPAAVQRTLQPRQLPHGPHR